MRKPPQAWLPAFRLCEGRRIVRAAEPEPGSAHILIWDTHKQPQPAACGRAYVAGRPLGPRGWAYPPVWDRLSGVPQEVHTHITPEDIVALCPACRACFDRLARNGLVAHEATWETED